MTPEILYQEEFWRLVKAKEDRIAVEEMTHYDAVGVPVWTNREVYWPEEDKTKYDLRNFLFTCLSKVKP